MSRAGDPTDQSGQPAATGGDDAHRSRPRCPDLPTHRRAQPSLSPPTEPTRSPQSGGSHTPHQRVTEATLLHSPNPRRQQQRALSSSCRTAPRPTTFKRPNWLRLPPQSQMNSARLRPLRRVERARARRPCRAAAQDDKQAVWRAQSARSATAIHSTPTRTPLWGRWPQEWPQARFRAGRLVL
jgi:hypothetical protein